MRSLKAKKFKRRIKKNILSICLICIFSVLTGILLKTGFASGENSYTLIAGQEFNSALKSLINSSQISYTNQDNILSYLTFDSFSEEKYGLSGKIVSLNWEDGISIDTTSEGNIKLFYNQTTKSAYVLSKSNNKIYFNKKCNFMFYNFKSLENISFTEFIDTNIVTDMGFMFCNCTNLKELDLSNFNTSNVYNMWDMFSNCQSLETLNVKSFDTSNVTQMLEMFNGCKNLKNLNLSSFNTSSVTTMENMFQNCESLQSLDLSSFNTSLVTTMNKMFTNCKNLQSLNVSSFDTSSVKYMDGMFRSLSSLTSLDLSNFDTSKVINMNSLFQESKNIQTLDLSKFDTSNVNNMSSMFRGCTNLQTLNLSGFNTSNVTDMSYMFYACESIQNLDLNSFDTIQVTNMTSMFNFCRNLQSLNINNFDTKKVTNMGNMFSQSESIRKLDLRSFNTISTTDMSMMFFNCKNLETIFVSKYNQETQKGWNTDNVTSSNYMFGNDNKLVGGYDSSIKNLGKSDKTYALIDSPIQKGYLTFKQEYTHDISSTYTLDSNKDIIINFNPIVHHISYAYLLNDGTKFNLEENNQYSIVDGELILSHEYLNTLEEGNYKLHIQNKDSLEENIIDLSIIKNYYTVIIKTSNKVSIDKENTIKIEKGKSTSIKLNVEIGYKISNITINGIKQEISGDKINITPTEDSEVIIETIPVQYNLVEENNPTHKLTKEGLIIKSDGPFEIFKSLEICENDICKEIVLNEDYTVKKGSTIIILSNKYLEKLSNGNYSYKINYKNETSIIGTFQIENGKIVGNIITNTGDSITNYISLYILSLISFITLTFLILKKKKQVKEELEII